jgi:hypothetical protein
MTTITPATNIFSISSSNTANWMASAAVAIQNQTDGGLIGSLSNAAKYKPGSIDAFLNSSSSGDLVSISQFAVTSATQLAIAQGDAVTKARSDAALQKALTDLAAVSNNVQPKNVLDPIIYFEDGSTIDTNQNIYTRPDGSQYDSITGTPYVDPANIVQLANGAYLNTQSNIMTMPDGSQIDMITGLNVNQLNPPDDGSGDGSGVDVAA